MRLACRISIISIIITALACGGAGGPITAESLKYDAPVLIQTTVGANSITIKDVAPNGKMVGSLGSAATGYYWPSPTSAPQQIAASDLILINDGGAMVGAQGLLLADRIADHAAGSSQHPTLVNINPVGLNDNNEIIAQASSFDDSLWTGIHWSASQQASIISTPSTSSELFVLDIANNGRIFGDEFVFGQPGFGQGIVWASSSSTGTFITGPTVSGSGNWQVIATNIQTGDSVAVFRDSSNTRLACGFLDSSSTAVVQIPGTGALPLGVSNNGIIIGVQLVGLNSVPVVWPNLTEGPIDINTLIPTGTGWVLEEAKFVLSNGDIIGRGSHTVGGVTTQEYFYLKRQ